MTVLIINHWRNVARTIDLGYRRVHDFISAKFMSIYGHSDDGIGFRRIYSNPEHSLVQNMQFSLCRYQFINWTDWGFIIGLEHFFSLKVDFVGVRDAGRSLGRKRSGMDPPPGAHYVRGSFSPNPIRVTFTSHHFTST